MDLVGNRFAYPCMLGIYLSVSLSVSFAKGGSDL
jgi:hypothetical protein